MARSAVTLTGEVRFFDQQSDRGNTVRRGFCPACGSPLLNENSAYPESWYIHAATLDDPGLFQPTTVLFSESSQPWDIVDPTLS